MLVFNFAPHAVRSISSPFMFFSPPGDGSSGVIPPTPVAAVIQGGPGDDDQRDSWDRYLEWARTRKRRRQQDLPQPAAEPIRGRAVARRTKDDVPVVVPSIALAPIIDVRLANVRAIQEQGAQMEREAAARDVLDALRKARDDDDDDAVILLLGM